MKNMRKIFAVVLAVMMVMAMATTAFAATITIQADEDSPIAGHTYEVYQIFTGTLSGTTLSDIKYGANYTPGDVTTGTLVPDSELEAITDAAAFAKDLVKNSKLDGDPVATLNAENNYTAADLADGYYLIMDVTEEVPEGDALSAYIIKVIDTVTITPKSETIISDKVIKSDDYADNNGVDDSVTTDGKTSNGAVGSTVNFELTVNVPTNAAGYTYYYCVLNDTLSEGLTFQSNSVEVYAGNEKLTANTDYILYTGDNAEGHTFQIAMLNAKTLAGKTITVKYAAIINENAVIGVEGNPNEFDVDYSNNPNYDYNDKNNNGKPDDAEDIPTGTTPKKTTHTYVTGIKLIKVDEDGNRLTGAEFQIEGTSIKYVMVYTETFTEDAAGDYWKLTDGSYTTEAPRTEDTYVEKTDNRDSGYVKNDDDTYSEATGEQLADESITLYTLLKANADSYASTETKYVKTRTVTVVGDDETEVNVTASVGEDGVLYFTGLGEGVYTITETKTPNGYNTIAPITVTIDWTAPENYPNETDCTWTASATTAGSLVLNEEGVFELTVENKSGSTLPETGGMGTTLFYVFGGILVLAAVVLLVTKKRMASAE